MTVHHRLKNSRCRSTKDRVGCTFAIRHVNEAHLYSSANHKALRSARLSFLPLYPLKSHIYLRNKGTVSPAHMRPFGDVLHGHTADIPLSKHKSACLMSVVTESGIRDTPFIRQITAICTVTYRCVYAVFAAKSHHTIIYLKKQKATRGGRPMDQHIKADIKRVFELQKKQNTACFNSRAAQRKASALLDAVTAHEEEIIEAIRRDVRKPYHEVKRAETQGTIKAIKDNMNNLDTWMAPKRVGSSVSPDADGVLMYEPKGVTLILPWNYPFMLTMAPLAAAIAATARL